MFIFIFLSCRRKWFIGIIYIPLCLYLYVTNFCIVLIDEEFTFHYVYIYILSVPMWSRYFFIYIPLCLYLYCYLLLYCNNIFYYLHSTMFIFIWELKEITDSFYRDLHSTMFIFISKGNRFRCVKITFTFHYVYIYISEFFSNYILRFNIYIPLCLYLYLARRHYCLLCYKFTFHYVYIYMLDKDLDRTFYNNLHSTMFIFIYNHNLSVTNLHIYLHSTMFIFIC